MKLHFHARPIQQLFFRVHISSVIPFPDFLRRIGSAAVHHAFGIIPCHTDLSVILQIALDDLKDRHVKRRKTSENKIITNIQGIAEFQPLQEQFVPISIDRR